MNKKQRLEKYYQKKAIEFDNERKWNRMRKFLEGFKPKYLEKIIKYHQLPCVDIRQNRCLMKTLRESNLSYQNIWEAIIHD